MGVIIRTNPHVTPTVIGTCVIGRTIKDGIGPPVSSIGVTIITVTIGIHYS
jgi:hypothetical protein